MGLDLALSIAQSGLAAVQRSLDLTAQNISNARTEGYTRKTVPQTALLDGIGPSGVRTGEAQRAVDLALQGKLVRSGADLAAAGLREQALAGVEQAHGTIDAGNTLSDGITALLNGFTSLAAAPADAGQQQATLRAASVLAGRLNDVSNAIGTARQAAQDGIVSDVDAANAALQTIARITKSLRDGTATDMASLEDSRDAAIAGLSKIIPVAVVRKPDNDITLIAGNGIVLPLDPNAAAPLATRPAITDPTLSYAGGGILPGVTLNGTDVTTQLSGGTLAENIRLRDSTLPRYQAELDLTAATLAYRMNAVGLRLFTDSDGTSVPDTTQPYAGSNQVGFAGRIQVNPQVAANPVLLRDGTTIVPAGGAPSAFTPNPSTGPAGFSTLIDRVRNFALGGNADTGAPWPAIATTGLGPAGNLSSPFAAPAAIGDYASRVTTAQVADRAAATDAKATATALHDALQSKFDATAGVDTDREMAAMVTLQNAYAANARVMNTVQAMWSALLGISP